MFTFDCASWNPNCLVVGHAVAAWLLKDLIPGERMALLSPQVGVGGWGGRGRLLGQRRTMGGGQEAD
jgi:hypothetical protein